jgi:hypothetical protein
MTALTSHRPLKKCSPSILANQLRAFESWRKVFPDRITFAEEDRHLSKFGFQFIPTDPFPRIVRMVWACSRIRGWSAIVNADIVVAEFLPAIERKLIRQGASCAVSWRYEFTESFQGSSVVDRGMDFFAADQWVWQRVLKIYPDEYRIGHSSWDAIMLGAFNIVAEDSLFDLTKHRLIFHPKHEDRQRLHHIWDNTRTECRDNCKWPSKCLRG